MKTKFGKTEPSSYNTSMFSCESDDESDEKVEVRHARTGEARKKKIKEKEEEDETFACKKCGMFLLMFTTAK